MTVKGDSLFVKETDKMENIIVVKYRCENEHAVRRKQIMTCHLSEQFPFS